MKTLGDRLKQRRQELGLTQVDIANRLGLTKATVSLWENGTNKPNGENFHTLAKTLKTSSEWLLSGKDSTADHDLSDGTGDRIRQLRKKAGLTQKELAKQVGVSAPAVTQWEGDEQLPKTDHAERLAMALKTNWQWIRYGEGQPTQSIAPTGRY
ncbi:MAG: helix-turn-helix transcriptional regulator, partial [Oceanobacter sp.]